MKVRKKLGEKSGIFVTFLTEVLRLLSGRIPVGQEIVLPLAVWNWLLLVECMIKRLGGSLDGE